MYFNIKYLCFTCFTLPIGHFWIWTVAKRQGRLEIIVECEVEGAPWRLCSVRSSAKSRSDVGSHGDESGAGVASDESQNSEIGGNNCEQLQRVAVGFEIANH